MSLLLPAAVPFHPFLPRGLVVASCPIQLGAGLHESSEAQENQMESKGHICLITERSCVAWHRN